MNKNQFLLTTQMWGSEKPLKKIGAFNLFLGEDSLYTGATNTNTEIHLLGDMYDWENPKFGNSEIIEHLLRSSELKISDLIDCTNKYCGEYVMIIKKEEDIFIFNDACSQREIYYSDDFLSYGTQVKLIENVCELIEHTDIDAQQFYQSEYFKKNKLHVGAATHKKNIYHLLPNHFINIKEKKVNRVSLPEITRKKSVDNVAKKASAMLKGYLGAISNRKKILLGLTAGYDSRVLFLASLGIKDCKYYVNATIDLNIKEDHYDIQIAKKLASIYMKELTIIKKDWKRIKFSNLDSEREYIDNLDFPRFSNIATKTSDSEVVINGNISEVARSYYGVHRRLTAEKLSILNGSSNLKFAIRQFDKWLENQSSVEKLGYNTLDMFYWEEKMGNWQSKTRTELHALDRNVVTPYNSRELLMLLLNTRRKNRDSHINKLYKKIIIELSNNNIDIINTPFNPCRKTRIILSLKYFKLYNLYKAVILRINLMKSNVLK